jgi:hypothetical protein
MRNLQHLPTSLLELDLNIWSTTERIEPLRLEYLTGALKEQCFAAHRGTCALLMNVCGRNQPVDLLIIWMLKQHGQQASIYAWQHMLRQVPATAATWLEQCCCCLLLVQGLQG